MGDAAHAELLDHEIFRKPFKVEPVFEEWDTPSNYRGYPGGNELPDKMKVWKVQESGKSYGGVVSRSYNFNDFPDDELLVKGFNTGKEYGAAGVGRHGSFLQWGYSSPPSKMTEAGRKLFVNCVIYIQKFDGKRPLVRRSGSPRMNVVRLAALINRIKDESFFSSTFPPDLREKYKGDPDGLVKYYRDNFELIYRRSTFFVDDKLKSLGIESNRKISTLEKLVELMDDPEHGKTARDLLTRYTTEYTMEEKSAWQEWLAANRGRIHFSDFGGYKFQVVPEGYLLETVGYETKD